MTIEQDYVDSHPFSAKLYERASRVLPSGVTHDSRFQRPFPIYVDHAQGPKKWDVDGHELVDYVMGHGSLILGHNNPAVTEALSRQAVRGSHYGASHALEVEWAEKVIDIVPSAEVVRFTSSGTEATMMALRLARAASGRPAILKFERHFHGWHDYVVASSHYGAAAPAGIPEATLDTTVIVSPEMHVVRETVASRPDIGTVIVEASGAAMGTVPLPRDFLHELQDFCRAEGLIVVMDEVVTGFRWSAGGVQQREGLLPDLTALAKILAGGLPGGAVAGRRDLMERLSFDAPSRGAEKVGHPGTFNANPLSAAAGVAALSQLDDGLHQARAETTAQELAAAMNGVLRDEGVPGFVYGPSSILKVVLGGDQLPEARAYHPLDVPADLVNRGSRPETQRLLNLAMINRGVQIFGNGLIVSAVHGPAEVATTLDAWRGALIALRDEGATVAA
jgi:glutamate-1-semialdehyde 2,1-aminomutase